MLVFLLLSLFIKSAEQLLNLTQFPKYNIFSQNSLIIIINGQVVKSVVMILHKSPALTYYKVSRPINPPNFLTDMPCGLCPVISRCSEDGIISPKTCEYLTQWLNAPDEGDVMSW